MPRFRTLAERVGLVPPNAFDEVEVLELLLVLAQFHEHGNVELAVALAGEGDQPGGDLIWELVRQWRQPDVQAQVQRVLWQRMDAAVDVVRRAQALEDLAALDPAQTSVVLYWLLRKLGRDDLAGELGRRYGSTLAVLEPLLWVCRVLLKAGKDAPEALDELRGKSFGAAPEAPDSVH